MKIAFTLITALAAAMTAQLASAQGFPTRAVRIIVPYAAGGNTDITARAVGGKLGDVLGQQVVVDNRPGGATNIGSELVVRAAPDGHTLLMAGAANAINMNLFAKPPYDTARDFAPVVLCVKGANVLSIHLSLYESTNWFGLMAPIRTPKDIVARLNTEVGKVLAAAVIKTRFINDGPGPIGGSQKEFAGFIRDETTKYAKVIKTAGIKPL